jgi:hypothetical protein
MADTSTSNYTWTKPEIGGSTDTWGTKWNANLDGIDTTVKAVSNVANAAQATANAALPAGSYTAADVKSKLLTVDGAGSGIDADLLDGNEAAAFFTYAANASNLSSGTLSNSRLNGNIVRHGGSYTSAVITVSSSDPSGGSDGDIWLKV